jgi:hypothetical protein
VVTPELRNGQAIDSATDAPGVYIAEQFQGEKLVARQRYAINLFDAAESKIAPQAALNVPQVSGLQQATTSERVGRQEFWRWLAALALVVLIVEWLVYQRNGIAYLRQRWRTWRARTAG